MGTIEFPISKILSIQVFIIHLWKNMKHLMQKDFFLFLGKGFSKDEKTYPESNCLFFIKYLIENYLQCGILRILKRN